MLLIITAIDILSVLSFKLEAITIALAGIGVRDKSIKTL
jgi:hypothetical protein